MKVKDLMEQLLKETKERAEAERKHREYMDVTDARIRAISELLDETAREHDYWSLH